MELIEEYINYNKRNYVKKLVEERFWKKVDKKSDNECWNWLASVDINNYGQIRYNDTMIHAHRLSYIINIGKIPKDKINICHKCHNRKCVNPKHLYACTQKENIYDMINAKRTNYAKGENNGLHVLTTEQIVLIRKERIEKGISYLKIARKYGVSESTIRDIISNKTWKDENYKKLYRHGNSGEHSYLSKLSNVDVKNIRNEYSNNKISCASLGLKYKMSAAAICLIINNKRYYDENYDENTKTFKVKNFNNFINVTKDVIKEEPKVFKKTIFKINRSLIK